MMACYLRSPVGRSFDFEELIGRETIERLPFFESMAIPLGLVRYLGLVVDRGGGLVAPMSLHRSTTQAEFDADERRLLDRTAAHLRRSIRIYAELTSMRTMREACEAALEALNSGVLLLRDDGRIVFANSAAKKILDERDGVRCRCGRLEATKVGEQATLDQLIAMAAGRTGTAPTGDGMRISRRAGGPLACMACPIGERHKETFDERPSVMLLLRSPNAPKGGRAGLLARTYGLSPRRRRWSSYSSPA